MALCTLATDIMHLAECLLLVRTYLVVHPSSHAMGVVSNKMRSALVYMASKSTLLKLHEPWKSCMSQMHTAACCWYQKPYMQVYCQIIAASWDEQSIYALAASQGSCFDGC